MCECVCLCFDTQVTSSYHMCKCFEMFLNVCLCIMWRADWYVRLSFFPFLLYLKAGTMLRTCAILRDFIAFCFIFHYRFHLSTFLNKEMLFIILIVSSHTLFSKEILFTLLTIVAGA